MLTKGGCLPINGIGLVSTYLVFWAGTALLFYAAMNYAKLLYLSVADLGEILAFQNSEITVFSSNSFLTIIVVDENISLLKRKLTPRRLLAVAVPILHNWIGSNL